MERFGAVGDDMEALVWGACGDLDRDRGEADLAYFWAFTAPSAFPGHLLHAAHHLGGRDGGCGDGGRGDRGRHLPAGCGATRGRLMRP
eukprot:82088-Prymnesium_polylepis.1